MQRSILTLVTITSLATPVAADEAAWSLITGIEVTVSGEGEDWRAIKAYPEPLLASAEAFTITGYLVPIMAQAYITDFLLVADPADCPFCGNSGYGPTLEVSMKRALPDLPEFTKVTVTGQLDLIEDPFTFQAVRLVDAVRTE